MTIRRLLVANRGEIARRVFHTCRDLGIETVAVFSDADAGMPFVAEADFGVRLPGNTPGETYLDMTRILSAARDSGADAVHPGYGFLSENADFAEQVIAAGITWVGPTPESMRAMATKIEAKQLMDKAGVPVLPELEPSRITDADLPVLVKASSGGGGRGMRVVRALDELAEAVELAGNEAASAFGDPTVFCEPYVEHGRHVEVQIVGDAHGHVEVVGDRDCSLQRRHQKVVEEAPAPGLSSEVRQVLHDAARAAGEAIAYVGAGTVEFLVEGDRVFFLEMNTRLQVEHPVTECVTGVDLVAAQIAVAEGGLAPVAGPGRLSHSIEVRLYAEDPAEGYQPQSGTLTAFDIPGVRAEFENPGAFGIRLDSGVIAGNEIGTFYDAMIAKVIVWAPTRAEALRRLAGALKSARIHGLRTNRDLLVNLLRDPVVVEGRMHTTYLDGVDVAAMARPAYDADMVHLAGLAAVLADRESTQRTNAVQRRIPAGWRNVPSATPATILLVEPSVQNVIGADHVIVSVEEGLAHVVAVTSDRVVLERDGVRHTFGVTRSGGRLDVDSGLGHLAFLRKPRFTDPADQVASGSLLAPMPGNVVAVHATVGDTVSAGQPLLVLEAMKMQHNVSAPHDGVVEIVDVAVGQQVAAGDVLAVVSAPIGSTEGEVA